LPLAGQPAHDGAIVGVGVESGNRFLVSASTDGVVRVWDFRKGVMVGEMQAGGAVSHMAMHPGNGLVAVAVEGLGLRLFDAEAGRLVRRFTGHR
jgi:U3 small nucleolar RNA-associated protein 21